ncbi:UNVERIFIED_CONTAM: hypothetical protein Slati_4185800 [Sesamum latifolium]|uniref:Uncharacterized protein n=1 Tax=Sesamum latifolium TaxID=2727402 RepID=A0AAW2TA16_9LAMI
MTASRLGFVFQRPQPSLPKMVKWIPPPDLWFKLNCNGPLKGNPGPAVQEDYYAMGMVI